MDVSFGLIAMNVESVADVIRNTAQEAIVPITASKRFRINQLSLYAQKQVAGTN
jgi:hypothetical protein